MPSKKTTSKATRKSTSGAAKKGSSQPKARTGSKASTKAPARKATTTRAAPKKALPKKAASTKAAPKKATRAGKPAARAETPPAPLPKRRAPAAAAAHASAGAKPARRKRSPTSLSVEELKELPTEEIWNHYRKAIHKKPRDEKWIETLRNALMELHYPLVRHIAERLLQTLPKSIELDDLVSAGLFGLMDAIRGFDPDRGIKFKTYCTTRIRGSILDQLRSQDWVPRLVRLKASRIEKALHKLQGEYGREPTHAELAAALRMDHGELATEISSSRAKTMYSLSERWDDRDDDGSMEKVEIVEDKDAIDPIGELNRRDLMVYITRSLTHKERFIIEQYYQVGHTMREIGEMLALTESRVCQIHSNVMARLKSLLGPGAAGLVP
jgi:RNA polymerase sigma factor for flagellar operon FliA